MAGRASRVVNLRLTTVFVAGPGRELALLAALQFLMAWISTHLPWLRPAFTSRPVVLLQGGDLCQEAMRRNRLSEAEVRQAVRTNGIGDLSKVGAVVLETNGTLSVIPLAEYGNGSANGGSPGG